jgi:hypothetical protein
MVIALGVFGLYSASIKRSSGRGVRCVFKSQECEGWWSIKTPMRVSKTPNAPGPVYSRDPAAPPRSCALGFEGCRN